MNSTDFAALSPLIILFIGALLLLLVESFSPNTSKKIAHFSTASILILALLANLYAPTSQHPLLTPWVKFDQLSQLFNTLFLLIGLATTFLSATFFQKFDGARGEYYFLLLAALFGLMLVGASADFLTLFLGLETLSLSLYVLCGYMKKWQIANEAAMKYLLIGAFAAALLIYGIALIYGAIGTTSFSALKKSYLINSSAHSRLLFLSGISLVTFSLGFKALLAPFQFFAPDVYQGSTTPITAFMAVGTKLGAFAALSQLFLIALPGFDGKWNETVSLLIYPTLIYANLLAIQQTDLKRFFAYSSMSHSGFLFILLVSQGPFALQALLFYLTIYSIATFGSFAVLTLQQWQNDEVLLENLSGLYRTNPLQTAILTLSLLTLAGIPPTAGFFAKFYLFKVAYQAKFYGLIIAGLLTTIVSAYYYLKILTVLFTDSSKENKTIFSFATFVGIGALIAISSLSIYPTALIDLFPNTISIK